MFKNSIFLQRRIKKTCSQIVKLVITLNFLNYDEAVCIVFG